MINVTNDAHGLVYGQQGINTQTFEPIRLPVQSYVDYEGGNAYQAALGLAHSCVLTTTGGVYCAGLATNGRLGNGETIGKRATWSAVSNLNSGVEQVIAGTAHSCALKLGDVFCWG